MLNSNRKHYSLILFIGILLISNLVGYFTIVRTIETRFLSAIESVEIQRGYQGLVLDDSGIASLVIALTERNNSVFIRELRINKTGGQEFFREFYPKSNPIFSGFLDSWPGRVRASEKIADLYFQATLLIPFPQLITSFFLSLFISGITSVLFLLFLLRNEQQAQLRISTEVSSLATQVAHDIRSPLAALDMVVSQLNALSEEHRTLLRSASNRIKDIANQLLEKNRQMMKRESGQKQDSSEFHTNRCSLQLLSNHIESIVTEKRMQFRSKIGTEIEAFLGPSSYGLFANIQPIEFNRAMSNLISNAVESIESTGQVQILLSEKQDQIEIRIQDNGRGIPLEVLKKLGQKGETFGKHNGSGLGLFHAKTSLQSWAGSLQIESNLGQGTSVILTLPKAAPPSWFVSELRLIPNLTIVILDDDASIHHIWERRFNESNYKNVNVKIQHFSTPEDLLKWHQNVGNSDFLYLLDYELIGHSQTGLDLIESLNIISKSILVTSRFEEDGLFKRCEKLGVRLIPKGLASIVPIILSTHEQERPKAILIDDDELIRAVWTSSAKAMGFSIYCFQNPQEFMGMIHRFDRTTPLYVDSKLGDGTRGEIASQDFYRLGFREIYLSTAYDSDSFGALPHIRGIRSKQPPWELPSENAAGFKPFEVTNLGALPIKS